MPHRRSGILLHITSLPSRFGIGDLGPSAYKFADTLVAAHQSLWQVLPLNPTSATADFSPYSSTSAFAGNPLLISPELLVRDGLLKEDEIAKPPSFNDRQVDFARAAQYKSLLLDLALGRFQPDAVYEAFCRQSNGWLDDFALFTAIRQHWPDKGWLDWPREVRDRRPRPLEAVRNQLRQSIEKVKVLQFLFFRQLWALREYCNARGVQLFGDMPLFVSHDSSDVWAHPYNFQLDREKRPRAVCGMPATRFNHEGQLWGMPIFAWSRLRRDGYEWWVQRIGQNLRMFNWLRIDHFLGLVSYWRIPAGSKSALVGRWVQGPGEDFFKALFRRYSLPALVAEDLGFVSAESREIMSSYNLPGMRILLDAFTAPALTSRFLPHNYTSRDVGYTGTHDYTTARGWFDNASSEEKKQFFDYIGYEVRKGQVHWEFIRLAMQSVAQASIYPMQDVLGLGVEARMNVPGTPKGNWRWRLRPEQLRFENFSRLGQMTKLYERD